MADKWNDKTHKYEQEYVPWHIYRDMVQGDRIRAERLAKQEKYEQEHKEEFENQPSVQDALDDFFKLIDGE